MRRTTGPYKVMKVRENTDEIDENGIPNTVSIDHMNPLTQSDDRTTETKQDYYPNTVNRKQETYTTTKRTTECTVREYSVGWIAVHLITEDTLCYVVCWYRYSAADDMQKPAENISKHFIDCYCNRETNKQNTKRK